MSEELTKLIDKTVGKKGRLRVPAYWMHKVLSGIVEYVKEQAEKLEKALASTSEKLSEEIATVKAALPEVIIHEGDIVSGDALEPTPFKKDCYLDILPSGCSFQYTERGVAEEYTVYAFMNPDSSFMGITVGHFGFYRINIFQHLELQSLTDIVEQKYPEGTGLAYATYVTTSNIESISLTEIRTRIYKGKTIGSSHTPGTAGEHSYIVIFDDYTNSATFKGNKKLVKIELGSGKYIHDDAFRGCINLVSVIIPDSVISIGWRAFYYCSKLKSVVIGNSVTSIGNWAFFENRALENIIIPNSVTSIEQGAFEQCYGLKSVTLSESLESIGDSAFDHCTELLSIIIPNSVTSIGRRAFYGCSELKSVTLSNSMTSIDSTIFYYCTSLTNITIPSNVAVIAASAFGYCEALKKVDFSSHTAIPALEDDARDSIFKGTPEDLKIIVPDALYDDWIVASNWSTYADHIVKASEYVETE